MNLKTASNIRMDMSFSLDKYEIRSIIFNPRDAAKEVNLPCGRKRKLKKIKKHKLKKRRKRDRHKKKLR